MQVSIKQVTRNDNLYEDYINVRKQVFIEEQNVSIELEIDEYDYTDRNDVINYVLLVDGDGDVCCCARVLIFDKYVKIGRVATLKKFRSKGLMTQLFAKIIKDIYYDYPRKRNIILGSQKHAVNFYRKLGFTEFGEDYIDANILHVDMKRQNISPFIFSSTNKRYYSLNQYYKTLFDCKVGKVMIEGGFTCPNIDGTKSRGGCSFCSIHGSGDFAGKRNEDLIIQYQQGYTRLKEKWPNAKAIAYFQAYSNTYSNIENLREKYEYFLNVENCEAIAIGTRPDCINEDVIELLSQINKKKPVFLELGLQSINEETATLFNRGYKLQEFENTMKLLEKYNIKPIIHIINGLPNDTIEDNLNTVKFLNKFKIGGLKIHMLHIMKRTTMGKEFQQKPWDLLTLEQYVDIVVQQIGLLNENVVLHRLTGDAPLDMLIAPEWTIKKTIVLNEIDKKLKETDTYQGKNYETL